MSGARKSTRKSARATAMTSAIAKAAMAAKGGKAHAVDPAAGLEAATADADATLVDASEDMGDVPPPSPQAAPAAAVATPNAAPAGLKLEASCTLRDTIDMQFQLLAVDFGDSEVRVDGSAVERIDTAGLQLLLSFARRQSSRGKVLKWTAASPELKRGSQVLGLCDLLGLSGIDEGSSARGN